MTALHCTFAFFQKGVTTSSIAGDFNCTLDPHKDRSSHLDKTHNRSRNIIHHFIKSLNLRDVWRDRNPDVSFYSCFSSTYKSYSRIDYYLVSASLMSKIKDCTYDSILVSDHAPNSLKYVDPGLKKDPPRWRVKQQWLRLKFMYISQ